MHEFEVKTEPLRFEPDMNTVVNLQFWLYPLFSVYYLDDPLVPTYPQSSYIYNLDVYDVSVEIHDEDMGFSGSEIADVNENNRYKPPTQTFYFTSGTPTYNQELYNKYIFMDSSGDRIGTVWSVDGEGSQSLVSKIHLRTLGIQHAIPRRMLSGELCSDPDDMDFGKILIDNYGFKYLCTGVEYDLKQGFWNGEWKEINDPDATRLGDFDADDFDTGDFWAI
jgi:hypothetical protein